LVRPGEPALLPELGLPWQVKAGGRPVSLPPSEQKAGNGIRWPVEWEPSGECRPKPFHLPRSQRRSAPHRLAHRPDRAATRAWLPLPTDCLVGMDQHAVAALPEAAHTDHGGDGGSDRPAGARRNEHRQRLSDEPQGPAGWSGFPSSRCRSFANGAATLPHSHAGLTTDDPGQRALGCFETRPRTQLEARGPTREGNRRKQ
jgi:hypothetical protein